ncbi:glycosyltransferase family 4 protein [Bacillus sp. KH172YL63]|uniref:glycosyltransferase family 4 protein n=1 Tax=Bacillus sp. KH172YL63 TaxID=2709784 RepID=UPI001566594A|nr:glycosyltransferase family 4 protein [Bacillus sp. KH172YL63]
MNLFKRLANKRIEQDVFVPIKDEEHSGSNQLPLEYQTVHYYYKNIVKKHDKFLYHNKISKQMKEIEKSLDPKEIDFIHAHTVFSDGGTAYKLHKKYGTDYIVSVRNTDINFFYKYAIHLRPFMYKILKNAKAVVFISHAYKQKTLDLLPEKVLSEIREKCHVIPNGADDYWHDQALSEGRIKESSNVRLLFIGLIDENKNLGTVIKACEKLIKDGVNASLEVVGNGPLEIQNKDLCKELGIQDHVVFHGYVKDQAKIQSIMNQSDIFVMPSYRETFGLVYIEAMSRGLPVIYSYEQGIDGFFKEGEVGYSVDPDQSETITEAIKKITQNYDEMSAKCVYESKQFNWDAVSNEYIKLYTRE